ncbi:MAG: type III pantothenate kinase [Candidatus Margulisiibacteriota bacterium]
MLLAIDIGNTNIVAALCDNGKIKDSVRFETADKRTFGFLSSFKNNFVEGVMISSVVPKIDKKIASMILKIYGVNPFFVSAGIFDGIMGIRLKNKREIGSDRLVNAFAASRLYGKPSIIIDFGTATTFCAVDRKGRYLGGAIAPGISISRDALYEKTAKLPLVDLSFPSAVIGTNTVSAMQSGILYGYVGIVESLVSRFKKVLGKDTRVIATGGLAGKISSKTDIIEIVDPDLTLKGLGLLWEKIWKISR